jgi:hypothetical protein
VRAIATLRARLCALRRFALGGLLLGNAGGIESNGQRHG